MFKFDLAETQAENDAMSSNNEYGAIVVKNDIPQLFIPISQDDIENWSTIIRIDPNHVEEISKTTRVYSGTISDDLIFVVDKKLF